MKLKLKYALLVRPDPKTGEYPDHIAKRLIAAGLATEDKSSPVGRKSSVRKRKRG